MRAKRRHTASPSYVDHLAQRGLDVKVSERSDATHDVAGMEIENVTGSDARGTILSRRRRRNADIESQCFLRHLIARDRIVVATPRLKVARDQIEHMLVSPDGGIGLGNLEVTIMNRLVDRNVDLQVVAGREFETSSIQRSENQFSDESGDAAIGDHAELSRLCGARPDA